MIILLGNDLTESAQSMHCLWPNYSTCRNICFINTVCFTSAHVSWIWITHTWFINKGMDANIAQKLWRFIHYFSQTKEAGKARVEIQLEGGKGSIHRCADRIVIRTPFSAICKKLKTSAYTQAYLSHDGSASVLCHSPSGALFWHPSPLSCPTPSSRHHFICIFHVPISISI